MELKNEQRLALPRQTVWEALNDPDVLQACIPGCESFDKVDENAYDAAVTAKVGPVKARFKGRVSLDELNPPESYTLSFEGQGGQAGFAKGSASVRLDEADGGTRIGYAVNATVGGKLAQLGSRLVKGAAEKTAAEFFDNFARHMGAGAEQESGGDEASDSASAESPASESGGNSRIWVWAVAAAVVAAVIALFAI
jgi:carbon monoxide dehydrogenase subunit G